MEKPEDVCVCVFFSCCLFHHHKTMGKLIVSVLIMLLLNVQDTWYDAMPPITLAVVSGGCCRTWSWQCWRTSALDRSVTTKVWFDLCGRPIFQHQRLFATLFVLGQRIKNTNERTKKWSKSRMAGLIRRKDPEKQRSLPRFDTDEVRFDLQPWTFLLCCPQAGRKARDKHSYRTYNLHAAAVKGDSSCSPSSSSSNQAQVRRGTFAVETAQNKKIIILVSSYCTIKLLRSPIKWHIQHRYR